MTFYQLPQYILGRLILLYLGKRVVSVDERDITTIYRYRPRHVLWGISLGPIIIIADHWRHGERTVRHEYGHSLQSRMLGPLYLIVVGIPSITMNILSKIGVLRRDRYYDRWPESWADRLGGVERMPT